MLYSRKILIPFDPVSGSNPVGIHLPPFGQESPVPDCSSRMDVKQDCGIEGDSQFISDSDELFDDIEVLDGLDFRRTPFVRTRPVLGFERKSSFSLHAVIAHSIGITEGHGSREHVGISQCFSKSGLSESLRCMNEELDVRSEILCSRLDLSNGIVEISTVRRDGIQELSQDLCKSSDGHVIGSFLVIVTSTDPEAAAERWVLGEIIEIVDFPSRFNCQGDSSW